MLVMMYQQAKTYQSGLNWIKIKKSVDIVFIQIDDYLTIKGLI